MKKLFLLSVLCPLLLGVALTTGNTSTIVNEINPEQVVVDDDLSIYADKLSGVENKTLGERNLVIGDNDLAYSNTFTQYGVSTSTNNSFIRFVTAVKGDLSSISYNLSFEQENSEGVVEEQNYIVDINTVYKGINVNGVTNYYGANGFTDKKEESTHYFACFTLEFKSEAKLNTAFFANINIEDSEGEVVSGLEKVTSLYELKYNNADDYNVLIIGANTLTGYSVSTFFPQLVMAEDGINVNYTECVSTTYTMSVLTDKSTQLGGKFYNNLATMQYDAIIIQITRRLTESATDVIESEFNSLKKIYPYLRQETNNIAIMAFPGNSNESIYTTEGGVINYTKTDRTEEGWTSKAIAHQYYADLAETWANEINKLDSSNSCKTCKFSLAYGELSNPTNANVGYLMGASFYMTIFGKTYDDTSVTNGISKVSTINNLKKYAQKHCLPSA